jgi:hypothetical protein
MAALLWQECAATCGGAYGAARSLRHVTSAQFVNILDMSPAHMIYRHRMLRRLGVVTVRCKQSRHYFVLVYGFSEIVDGAELHSADGGSDIAVTRENNGACFGPSLLERRNDSQSASVAKSHFHQGIGGCAQPYLGQTIRDRFSRGHLEAFCSHRTRKALQQRYIVIDDQHSM